jgi:TonB family protein
VATAAPTQVVEIEKPKEVAAGQPYFDFQVEVPVTVLPGSVGPRYPEALRAQKVSGTVLAQFVVNTDGIPEMSTFKAVRSPDEAFTASVRDALGSMRFKPALIGGKAVRQLVQAPFAFMLDGKSAAAAPAASSAAAAGRAARADSAASAAPVDGVSDKPFFDFQTEKPATVRAGAKGPLYPEALREAKVEGQVLAQFIVDANGQVDMRSFKVLKSDHPDFTQAVKDALAAMTFEPAQVKGRAVKQLLQQPFQFSLSR